MNGKSSVDIKCYIILVLLFSASGSEGKVFLPTQCEGIFKKNTL